MNSTRIAWILTAVAILAIVMLTAWGMFSA